MTRILIVICFIVGYINLYAAPRLPLSLIQLPPDFHISIYADNVPNARQMTLGDKEIVFVGTRENGRVYALLPNATRTAAERVFTIARNLNMPNGVAFHKGSLYVAEVSRILRFDNIVQHLARPPQYKVVYDKFPKHYHHGWKHIAFNSDASWLYVPVGAPCNICLREDRRFATIMRMHPDGTNVEIYAEGVRNSVGFDWDPDTKELWFTDNGRDWLGDDLPPDELNHAPRRGMHFGFPYVYGNNQPDRYYKPGYLTFTPPAQALGPHVAALGMAFYTGKLFPKKYHKQIFIAEHGSWNRSRKIGYRITLVKLKNNQAIAYENFATGWLQRGRDWGRPVDVLVMPDGALLVSDDKAGAIYRISYSRR